MLERRLSNQVMYNVPYVQYSIIVVLCHVMLYFGKIILHSVQCSRCTFSANFERVSEIVTFHFCLIWTWIYTGVSVCLH